ncbi:hypothetical protein MC885_020843 [Smutsia gigantea]|nr:hypothetical protein MC885_020843 [Smutsia gigantea]
MAAPGGGPASRPDATAGRLGLPIHSAQGQAAALSRRRSPPAPAAHSPGRAHVLAAPEAAARSRGDAGWGRPPAGRLAAQPGSGQAAQAGRVPLQQGGAESPRALIHAGRRRPNRRGLSRARGAEPSRARRTLPSRPSGCSRPLRAQPRGGSPGRRAGRRALERRQRRRRRHCLPRPARAGRKDSSERREISSWL